MSSKSQWYKPNSVLIQLVTIRLVYKCSIVILGWHYHEKDYHVEFLTDDNGLKSQEPPPPTPPIRRSSRRK